MQSLLLILVSPPGYFLSNSATSVVPLYFMNTKQGRDTWLLLNLPHLAKGHTLAPALSVCQFKLLFLLIAVVLINVSLQGEGA